VRQWFSIQAARYSLGGMTELSQWMTDTFRSSYFVDQMMVIDLDDYKTERVIKTVIMNEWMNFREGERERETEGEREPQAGSTPSADPNVGLDPMTPRSWPELRSRVGRLINWAHPCTPVIQNLNKQLIHIISFNCRSIGEDEHQFYSHFTDGESEG